ncbi:hypothetical protein COCNU_01G017440 [Cocos nucifera]|uniref:Uncharacterized protein n=1 Tax=Cocos nucifera TaxID=13894 RepID=A0A8K0HWE8_COCNU|nr:hypothetical protein COCNU_01G017440 [Cocos nucifera]
MPVDQVVQSKQVFQPPKQCLRLPILHRQSRWPDLDHRLLYHVDSGDEVRDPRLHHWELISDKQWAPVEHPTAIFLRSKPEGLHHLLQKLEHLGEESLKLLYLLQHDFVYRPPRLLQQPRPTRAQEPSPPPDSGED